jgi:hypothetical protein
VRQVNLPANEIRLEDSKNGEGREVTMTREVRQLIAAAIEGKRPDEYVFTRNGKPVGDFRKAWQRACIRAGLGQMVKVDGLKHPKYVGLLVHDTRRSGIRFMRLLGIDPTVIMKTSGHKTNSMFRRYNITDKRDQDEVARKLDEKNANRSKLGIIAPETVQSENLPTVQ